MTGERERIIGEKLDEILKAIYELSRKIDCLHISRTCHICGAQMYSSICSNIANHGK